MTNESLVLKLYISGNSPNSLIAIRNLKAICTNDFPLDNHQIEIVDLFQEPLRALEDGVMLTPMLIVASSPPVSVIGNLSDTSSVVNLIMSAGRENGVS